MTGNTILVILLVGLMIAVLVALVRGIIAFLSEQHATVRGEAGPSSSQLKSNKAMQARIFFQALAILVIVVILFANGRT